MIISNSRLCFQIICNNHACLFPVYLWMTGDDIIHHWLICAKPEKTMHDYCRWSEITTLCQKLSLIIIYDLLLFGKIYVRLILIYSISVRFSDIIMHDYILFTTNAPVILSPASTSLPDLVTYDNVWSIMHARTWTLVYIRK